MTVSVTRCVGTPRGHQDTRCPKCGCPVFKVVGRTRIFREDGQLSEDNLGTYRRCVNCHVVLYDTEDPTRSPERKRQMGVLDDPEADECWTLAAPDA